MEKGYQSVKLKKTTVDMLRRDGSSYSNTIEALVNGECNMVSAATHKGLCKSLDVPESTPLDELLKSYIVGNYNEKVAELTPVGSNIHKALVDLGTTKDYAIQRAINAEKLCSKEVSAIIPMLVKQIVLANAKIKILEEK